MMPASCEKSERERKGSGSMSELVRLMDDGAHRRAAPPDPEAAEAEHYLRLDLAIRFLDIVWAEGLAAGREDVRSALRETRLSFPMPAQSEALASLERRLNTSGEPRPPEAFSAALRALMGGPTSGPEPR
jgi:hypothetical protein